MSFVVRAPASTANLGPGFDCAAAALELWNDLHVERRTNGSWVEVEGEGATELPRDGGHLALRAFALFADPADYHFRFVATNLQYFRNVDLGLVGTKNGTTRRSESLTMSFNVFSEPKLPFLGMGEARVTAAYDSEKNSMLPVDNTVVESPFGARRVVGRYYGSGQRSLMLSGSVNLQRVSEIIIQTKRGDPAYGRHTPRSYDIVIHPSTLKWRLTF